jgi:hypothetical protein
MASRLSLNEGVIAPSRFVIDIEIHRQYRRFNAAGTQLSEFITSACRR